MTTTRRIGKRIGTTQVQRPLGRLLWGVPVLAILLLAGGSWLLHCPVLNAKD